MVSRTNSPETCQRHLTVTLTLSWLSHRLRGAHQTATWRIRCNIDWTESGPAAPAGPSPWQPKDAAPWDRMYGLSRSYTVARDTATDEEALTPTVSDRPSDFRQASALRTERNIPTELGQGRRNPRGGGGGGEGVPRGPKPHEGQTPTEETGTLTEVTKSVQKPT